MAWDAALQEAGQVLQRGPTDWVMANPLEAAGLVLGTLVLLVGLWYAVRWYLRPPGGTFKRVLAREDAVTVLLHPNPDPDAMAAAMGVVFLAETVDTDATMRFPGEIRHQQNRAFRTILDLDVEVIETAGDLGDNPVVLVDHNEPRGFQNAEGIDPLAVIDHHPGRGTGTSVTDVRPEYGSCATILTEYLRDLGFDPMDPDRHPQNGMVGDHVPTEVATGLAYGILSDTSHLTKGCTEAEFAASSFLYPGVDQELLDRIANPQVDAEVLDVKARAISERTVEGPYAVSTIGEVSNVDAIPQAADELLRLEGVTAVVVAGSKNGTLHVSGRSRDDRVHMGEALERVVEDIPQSGAGGHSRMGGGQISLDHMQGLGPGSGVSMDEFVRRLFRSLAGEELVTPA